MNELGSQSAGFNHSCAEYLVWDPGQFSAFLSTSSFSHLKTEDNNSTYLIRL